ncbi:type VII secretion-associated serine protease mycosin [Phytohabitans sp. ZYX-F-186]|uniref:Type VII secretion-associated serine protease mycosin n=1 Tax=Phytohabitans maris TaxID=3071409 RepID=A0ABU0ZT39_9ACTN|nr:type VII secretion-associated serine protease mycosin [Phytohabitans sp. ZYX-F-186]MDQ7909380.1 type VII secretion-associated serine protease mycosin [Phytohabitans sp. ZYX-F-186]
MTAFGRPAPRVVAAVALVAVAAVPTPPSTADGACLPAPTSTETGVPWGQQRLGVERAWPLSRGQGVTVAVVDTGVDGGTPQLRGRVLPGQDLTATGRPRADNDCFGHGTFVAGIVAAAPAEGTGFTGVAPDARILPVRVANTMEDGTAARLAQGVRAAVDAGAKVVNISASTPVPDPSLVAAVEYAERRDVVVVAAAANGAERGQTVAYPAAFPTVVAVGAIDSGGGLANFSQTGKHLGLVAPGVDVTSVGPRGAGHWQGSGTSYAVPFVSGTAALVRAYRPGLTAAQVRARLLATADHPAAAMPDPGFGWGVVNPAAAVSAVLPEEGGASAAEPPPAARHPDLPPPDPTGPRLAALAAGAAVVATGLVALLAVLLPAANRRRWRPARSAVVDQTRR